MTRESLSRSLLRLIGPGGDTAGLAVLVGRRLAVTTRQAVDRADRSPRGALAVERALGAEPARSSATVVETGPRGVGRTAPDQAVVLRLETVSPGMSPALLAGADGVWGHRVHLFGYPPGLPDGAWSAGVLRDETAFGWVQVDPEPGGYAHSAGFAGTAVWDDEAGGVVGILSAGSGELVPVRQLLAAAPELLGTERTRSPFRGLSAFAEADSPGFFGRDAEAAEIESRLRQERWVTVVGDSGVGKSSLVLAGVVPRMRAAGYDVVVARPPDDGLAHVHETVREHARSLRPLLVVLDQAEELLAGEASRSGTLGGGMSDLFGDTLPPHVRVLTTARLDLIGRLADDDGWRRLVRTPHLYPLGPLGPDGLRSMVTQPLEGTGVRYEQGLVEAILADADPADVPLPSLGHLLQQLWLARSDATITHSAYRGLGGVVGSVARHADTVWGGLEAAGAGDEARLLLTRLIDLRAVGAQPVRRPVEAWRLTAGQWRVAQHLTAERLLVTRGTVGAATVELAHEEILRAWHRLRSWVDQDRAVLAWQHGIRRDAARWVAAGRDDALLPGSRALGRPPVAEAERLAGPVPGPQARLTAEPAGGGAAGLEETELEYLAAARRSWRARRRARAGRWLGFGLVAATVAVLATLAGISSVQAREHARLAGSRALAHASQDLQRTDPVLAIMTSLAAYDRAPTREARDQLMRRYLDHAYQERVASSDPSDVEELGHSRDGDVLMTSHKSGRIVLTLDLVSGPARTLPVPRAGAVDHFVLADDGRRAVFFREGGDVEWFDIDPRAVDPLGPVHRLPAPDIPRPDKQSDDDSTADLASLDAEPTMTEDGRYLVAGMADRLVWWDLEQGRDGSFIGSRPMPDLAWSLSATADKDVVVAAVSTPDDTDYRTKLVAVDRTGAATRDVTPFADVVKVSGNGAVALVCQKDGDRATVRRFDTATGELLSGAYRGAPDAGCGTLAKAWDSEGRRVYRSDGSLWDLEAGRLLSRPGTLPTDSSDPYGNQADSSSLVERGSELAYLRSEAGALVAYDLPTSGIWELDDVWYSIVSDDGSEQVAVADGGERLVAVPVDPEDGAGPLATADRLRPVWEFEQGDRIMYSADGRHLLGREALDVVTVRDAATLQVVSTIKAVTPEVVEPQFDLSGGDNPGPVLHKDPTSEFRYWFDHDGNVVTRSDTLLQLWDARTGKESARFDVAALQPEGDTDPLTIVNSHPDPGTVLVTTFGQEGTDVVDLRTGQVTETIATPGTAVTAQLDSTGESMAVLNTGATMDLYTLDPLRKVSGPHALDPYSGTLAVYAFDDQGRFVIAMRDSIQILEVGSAAPADAYQFGDPLDGSDAAGGFMQLTSNAEHVVRLPSKDEVFSGALSLDPDAWREHLCEVISGRDFTDDEIEALPVPVSRGDICPVASIGR